MLASISRELSLSIINIASLSLGRKPRGDLALSVVNINCRIDEEIRHSIYSIDGIKDVYMVII